MRIFIGMETSGVMRRAFAAAGHDVISCDLLESQDDAEISWLSVQKGKSGHLIGDVFEILNNLQALGWWPDIAVFHPDCTYFTISAAWAFKDPDFERYPGVGYHMKLNAGTLTGKARRDRQQQDLLQIHRIQQLPIRIKVIENPIGQLSSLWMKPSDVVQPYEFGDDASKATCLWFLDKDGNRIDSKLARYTMDYVKPTLRSNGKSYWSNQTDTGQNKLGPNDDRWQKRADTYKGIAQSVVIWTLIEAQNHG